MITAALIAALGAGMFASANAAGGACPVMRCTRSL